MNVQYASRVVREIVDRALWGENDFTVVDVGASGGIAEMWSGFEPRLAGVGFDPLVENMRQIAEAEKRPKLRYEAAFVGCHDDDSAAPPAQWALGLSPRLQPDPFPRTSSAAAQEKHQFDYVGRVYNNSDDFKVSTRFVTLDDCAAEALLAHPTLTTTEERTCLLNLLVMATGFSGTYDDHIRRFESDLESFYPRAYDQDAWFLPPERRIALLKQESRTLKQRVADYKLKLDIERQRCARLRAKLKKLQTEQG